MCWRAAGQCARAAAACCYSARVASRISCAGTQGHEGYEGAPTPPDPPRQQTRHRHMEMPRGLMRVPARRVTIKFKDEEKRAIARRTVGQEKLHAGFSPRGFGHLVED